MPAYAIPKLFSITQTNLTVHSNMPLALAPACRHGVFMLLLWPEHRSGELAKFHTVAAGNSIEITHRDHVSIAYSSHLLCYSAYTFRGVSCIQHHVYRVEWFQPVA